jgi:predicted DNA-binding transcriptional regulator AlpA
MGLLTVEQLRDKLHVSKSYVFQLERNDPQFPRGIRLSARVLRWSEEEVNKWLESKKESTNVETAGAG